MPGLIKHPSSAIPEAHRSTFRLAFVLTVPLTLSLLIFALFTWQWLPIVYLLYIAIALIIPTDYLSRRGRTRFLTTLRRISVGGLATDQDGRFGDILMADVLTSYAKPLADLYIVACHLMTGRGIIGHPDRSCGGKLIVPMIIATPFL